MCANLNSSKLRDAWRKLTMGDIGEEQEEVEFEPLPVEVPVEAPKAPQPVEVPA